MANILKEIIDHKRKEVEQQKAAVSVEQLKEQIKALPKCRNFHRAVAKSNPRGINVIAEIKKASPSAGVIRQNFDPVEIAKIYEACGADAISVLTDEKYFQDLLSGITNAACVKISAKYICRGSVAFSPSLNAGVEVTGEIIASTFSNALSKSPIRSERTFCALR